MKRDMQKWQMSLHKRYGKIAAVGILVLGGFAMKPAAVTIARLPVALSENDAEVIQATANERSRQRDEQTRQVRAENYDLNQFPVTNQNEKHWRNILWTTAVVEPQEPYVESAVNQILGMMTQSGLSTSQQKTVDSAAKVATQLYLRYPSIYGSFEQRFLQAIDSSPDPEWVAVSLSALAKGKTSITQLQGLAERVKSRFPNWQKNIYLYTTIREVAEEIAPSPMPPLKDLLNWTIAPRQLQLYVLCRPNRDVLCQAILKDRDGQLVRNSDGKLWSVPLLLKSIHNLSWNFVRGQTPQGVYRIEGIVPQPDNEFFRAYGRFSLVKLFVPFEPGAKQFLPGKSGAFSGNLNDYQSLLPPSWRNYWAVQQSYWAGKIGRGDFRIHGTGEAPDFFSNKGSNPDIFSWNPTIGCLSALELYNEKGQLVEAHMPKLLGGLRTVGGNNFAGYMVVVELPGQSEEPISLQEIDTALGNKGRSSANVGVKAKGVKKKLAAVKPTKLVKTTLELKPMLEKSNDQTSDGKNSGDNSKNSGDRLANQSVPDQPEPEKPAESDRKQPEIQPTDSVTPLPVAY